MRRTWLWLAATLATLSTLGCSGGRAAVDRVAPGVPEDCTNRVDDDGDGAVDCVDAGCRTVVGCAGQAEDCADRLDNDLDGAVDCTDSDCSLSLACGEDCGNQADDNADTLVDCDDPICNGVDPRCGEICGDGIDNDSDQAIDCNDPDCYDVIPPCGGGMTADGSICAYSGAEPHVCACADGADNDGDGQADGGDLQCFGPFDDDEASYATGIPGDNKGSKGDSECPFDGNSGPGNDDVCCNPADPTQNVTPNGCDAVGCCEVDVNQNGTGEFVYVRELCTFTPTCGTAGTLGCACSGAGCDPGQFCVADDDTGASFCATCEACVPDVACLNPCACGELCFGGFAQPAADCGGGGGGGGTCPTDVTACPNGDGECDAAANERCSNGCCFPICPAGVTPCQTYQDCGSGTYYCITGCCVDVPV